MTSPLTCSEVRALAGELATGTGGGEERAAAAEHLAGCSACSRVVSDLASAADALLLLAPREEPPPGFEAAVMARLESKDGITGQGNRRRRAKGPIVGLVAAALAALLGFGVARALEPSSPKALAVGELHAADGQMVGLAYVYAGSSPWVVVDVEGFPATDTYEVEMVFDDGRSVAAGDITLRGGHGTVGAGSPRDAGPLRLVRFVSGTKSWECKAVF